MCLMLQQDNPNDYVIGTGETHSVKEFLIEAFNYADLDWEKYIEIDPKYYRPTEVEVLKADYKKAKETLNWSPRISFKELVKIMVDADFELNDLSPKGEGKSLLKEKEFDWIND